jgi:hypothetical protein
MSNSTWGLATSQPKNTTARYVALVPFRLNCVHSTFLRRESKDALAELKALANIIQSSVEQIEAVVASNSFVFPSSDSPFSPESETPRMHPDILSAGSLITSAAAQLTMMVRPAPLTVFDVMMQVELNVLWTMC